MKHYSIGPTPDALDCAQGRILCRSGIISSNCYTSCGTPHWEENLKTTSSQFIRRIQPYVILGLAVAAAIGSISPHQSIYHCAEFSCMIAFIEAWFFTLLAVLLAIVAALGGRSGSRNAAILLLMLTLSNVADAMNLAWRISRGYSPTIGLEPDRAVEFLDALRSWLLVYLPIPVAGLIIVLVIWWYKTQMEAAHAPKGATGRTA